MKEGEGLYVRRRRGPLGAGAPHEGLQLLTSGRASTCDSEGARSRQYSPGDAIWPVDPTAEKVPAVSAVLARAREPGAMIEWPYVDAKQAHTEFSVAHDFQ